MGGRGAPATRARRLARALVAGALLAAGLGALPGAAAEWACSEYQTETHVVPGTSFYVRRQAYRCGDSGPGGSEAQHVEIVRVVQDGGAAGESDDAILLHVEYHAFGRERADGSGSHETFVMLHDGEGRVGYHELEYTDQRASSGTCSSTVSYYRGSQTSAPVSRSLPLCLANHDVLA